MAWHLQKWKYDYVAVKDEEIVRFKSHAQARAYVHGRNCGKCHQEAMEMSQKESSATV